MSIPEHGPKPGFLKRIFGRSTQNDTPPARNKAGEIIMPAAAAETVSGKRVPKVKSVLLIALPDSSVRRWKHDLEEAGYGVEAVDVGSKGLDILYGFSFDAVLMDYSARHIDGLELLQQIRAQDELKGLFIGVFARDKSGRVDQEMAALDAGANRVFQRATVSGDEILTSLKTALFPRILQAQPRSKQAPASKLGTSAGSVEIPAPADLPVPAATTRTISLPGLSVNPENVSSVRSLNKKVLIIDADESVASIYRAQIESAGYEVEVALDGETGFHALYTQNPDALLLDLLLPGGLSGSEILKKTRAQKKFEKIPILVFTNIYTRDVEEEAKAAGVMRLFNKAAATPRDVVDALNEIFLPSDAVFGGAPSIPGPRQTVKINLPPLTIKPGMPMAPGLAAAAAAGPSAPLSRIETADDREFQAEIRESLLQGAPDFLKSLRGLLQVLLRSQGDAEAQSVQILELYTRVHSLTGNAAIAGFSKVARLAGALEAMLREFQTKPEGLNPSTKRTLTQAMDFLAMLFTNAALHENGAPLQEQILVVDDEIISRRVIGHSLEKAGLKSTAVSHPDEALKLLNEQRYDLVFLDVEMPGMNGFDLCKKLRAMPLHAKTPVIFVTALSGFESRAKSSLSGGDDFIGKPFSYIELAVKGLIYVLRGTLPESIAAPAPKPSLPAPAANSAAVGTDPLVVSSLS